MTHIPLYNYSLRLMNLLKNRQNKSEPTGVAIFIFRLPWLTFTLDTGVMMRDSIPVLALYEFCLLKPGSMTYMMLSMVKEVSAMLVAKTTLRAPGGVGSNT